MGTAVPGLRTVRKTLVMSAPQGDGDSSTVRNTSSSGNTFYSPFKVSTSTGSSSRLDLEE